MCTPEPGYEGQATNWLSRVVEDDYAANPNKYNEDQLSDFGLITHEKWDAEKARRSRQGVDSPPDMVNNRRIDPNAPRKRTSYSDRNTPRKDQLQVGKKPTIKTSADDPGINLKDPSGFKGQSGINI